MQSYPFSPEYDFYFIKHPHSVFLGAPICMALYVGKEKNGYKFVGEVTWFSSNLEKSNGVKEME